VAMRANCPIVDRGSRGNRVDVNEIGSLKVRRLVLDLKQRECRGGHIKSYAGTVAEKTFCRRAGAVVHSNSQI